MGKPNAPLLGENATRFGDIGLISEGCDGLTIRQYFMAHAPAEPQKWFKPVMGPRPNMPNKYEELSEAERREWEALKDGCDTDSVEVILFDKRWQAARADGEAYDAEYIRQKCAQWPAAWADAVLAASGDQA